MPSTERSDDNFSYRYNDAILTKNANSNRFTLNKNW